MKVSKKLTIFPVISKLLCFKNGQASSICSCSNFLPSVERYLKELTVLSDFVEKFKPELIIYLAGADPYKEDLLAGFK